MLKTITVENLESFPKNIGKKAEGSYSITFGDMHANALRMLHNLIVTGIIKIEEQQYKEFVSIYKKTPDELTEDDIIKFNNILNKVKPGDNKYSMVRFLGDLLADRGNNDYFILKLLQRLENLGIAYKITLSNHDIEFVNSYFNNDFDKVQPDNMVLPNRPFVYKSLNGLNSLISRQIINKEEAGQIAKKNVLNKMELISYEVDEKNKTLAIYTHAPIPLESIIKYAVDMKLAESKENKNITLQDVTELLDKLNKHLKENLKSKESFNLIKLKLKINDVTQEFSNKYDVKYDEVPNNVFNHKSFENIYAHAICCYDGKFEKSHYDNFSITYCHGHVGKKTFENTTNLDSYLGKGSRDNSGTLYFQIGQIKSIKISEKSDRNKRSPYIKPVYAIKKGDAPAPIILTIKKSAEDIKTLEESFNVAEDISTYKNVFEYILFNNLSKIQVKSNISFKSSSKDYTIEQNNSLYEIQYTVVNPKEEMLDLINRPQKGIRELAGECMLKRGEMLKKYKEGMSIIIMPPKKHSTSIHGILKFETVEKVLAYQEKLKDPGVFAVVTSNIKKLKKNIPKEKVPLSFVSSIKSTQGSPSKIFNFLYDNKKLKLESKADFIVLSRIMAGFIRDNKPIKKLLSMINGCSCKWWEDKKKKSQIFMLIGSLIELSEEDFKKAIEKIPYGKFTNEDAEKIFNEVLQSKSANDTSYVNKVSFLIEKLKEKFELHDEDKVKFLSVIFVNLKDHALKKIFNIFVNKWNLPDLEKSLILKVAKEKLSDSDYFWFIGTLAEKQKINIKDIKDNKDFTAEKSLGRPTIFLEYDNKELKRFFFNGHNFDDKDLIKKTKEFLGPQEKIENVKAKNIIEFAENFINKKEPQEQEDEAKDELFSELKKDKYDKEKIKTLIQNKNKIELENLEIIFQCNSKAAKFFLKQGGEIEWESFEKTLMEAATSILVSLQEEKALFEKVLDQFPFSKIKDDNKNVIGEKEINFLKLVFTTALSGKCDGKIFINALKKLTYKNEKFTAESFYIEYFCPGKTFEKKKDGLLSKQQLFIPQKTKEILEKILQANNKQDKMFKCVYDAYGVYGDVVVGNIKNNIKKVLKNPRSQLSEQQSQKIKQQIDTLKKEVERIDKYCSCFAFFTHKSRKNNKIKALNELLKEASSDDNATSLQDKIKMIKQKYPDVTKGFFSCRVKNLLNGLIETEKTPLLQNGN